ncbi:MAG: NADH dehydrogenase FAD-containing subunit [Treponema sp.]|nr:NADH dehydrogenase FAD-containing subunit [Treponema sp.]
MDVEREISAIKAQLEERPGAKKKLSMIVFSGDLDKQIAALVIATGAAAMGMEVILFYTFWGTSALRDPKKRVRGKDLVSRMFGFMLPKGWNRLKLSQMEMAGAGSAMIKGLMKKKNVASLDELYAAAGAMGVKIFVCEMSMDLMGIRREELVDYPGLESVGVATFLSHAGESSIQLFL